MREELAQVVMAAVRGQRALVDKSWQPLRAHVTRRQPLGQVSPEREVGKYERARGYLMPRTDGAEQLLGHRDQAGAPLDRLLLEAQRVVRFREAVLVRRPAQALEIVDVVDPPHLLTLMRPRPDRPRGIPHQCALVLIGLAGFPTATVYGSRSLTTTLPAPTTQLSPIFTPGRITTPIPIQTFLPTSTGRSTCQPCSVTGRSGSSMLWLAVWIIVYGPKFAPS